LRVARAWLSGDEWWPASRGRSWAFDLATSVIVSVLDAVAERRQDAFTLLQCRRIDVAGESQSVYSELSVHALALDGPW